MAAGHFAVHRLQMLLNSSCPSANDKVATQRFQARDRGKDSFKSSE